MKTWAPSWSGLQDPWGWGVGVGDPKLDHTERGWGLGSHEELSLESVPCWLWQGGRTCPPPQSSDCSRMGVWGQREVEGALAKVWAELGDLGQVMALLGTGASALGGTRIRGFLPLLGPGPTL